MAVEMIDNSEKYKQSLKEDIAKFNPHQSFLTVLYVAEQQSKKEAEDLDDEELVERLISTSKSSIGNTDSMEDVTSRIFHTIRLEAFKSEIKLRLLAQKVCSK